MDLSGLDDDKDDEKVEYESAPSDPMQQRRAEQYAAIDATSASRREGEEDLETTLRELREVRRVVAARRRGGACPDCADLLDSGRVLTEEEARRLRRREGARRLRDIIDEENLPY